MLALGNFHLGDIVSHFLADIQVQLSHFQLIAGSIDQVGRLRFLEIVQIFFEGVSDDFVALVNIFLCGVRNNFLNLFDTFCLVGLIAGNDEDGGDFGILIFVLQQLCIFNPGCQLPGLFLCITLNIEGSGIVINCPVKLDYIFVSGVHAVSLCPFLQV